MKPSIKICAASLLAIASMTSAAAETHKLRIAQQYGLSSLPLLVMEDSKLIEKHAQAAGLKDLEVTWLKLGGPGALTEAIISGDIDFGNGGVPALVTLWEKTRKLPIAVRASASVTNMPMDLLTTNPDVKTIADFTSKDKIAVPTIKVSNQAMLLEMAAAKEFGQENYAKLDSLTVSLPHPDAMTALLSGSGAVTAHFSAMPFQNREMKDSKVRTILSSYDVLGGPATNTVAFTTTKFYQNNPKTYAVFVAALEEANTIINADKRAAAETYKRVVRTNESVDELYSIIADPRVQFTTTPSQTMKVAEFMHKIGRLKSAPSTWKDLFFPNVHALSGS